MCNTLAALRATRRRGRGIALLALALALTCVAPAGALTLPAIGTFSLAIGDLPPIVATGAGLLEVERGSNGAITRVVVPAGFVSLATTLPPPVSLARVVDLRVDAANSTLVLSPGARPCDGPSPLVGCEGIAPLHGRGGLAGTLRVGLFGSFGAPATTMPIDLSPIGGAGTATGFNTAINASASLFGAGFTTGRATAIRTHMGVPFATTTAHGGVTTGPGGLVTIQLVTPVAFRSNLISSDVVFTGIGRFELQLVPEPMSAVLLAAGLGALAAGRRNPRWRAPRC